MKEEDSKLYFLPINETSTELDALIEIPMTFNLYNYILFINKLECMALTNILAFCWA